MKNVLLLMMAVSCLTSLHAQTIYAEMGAVGSFFSQYSERGRAFGGQLTANYQFSNGILLGAGVQALHFNKPFQYGVDSYKGYYPLYAKVGYNISIPHLVVSIHSDQGYSFYSNTGIGPADGPVPIRGGFYFSPGIGLYARKKLSPYLDVRYTRYQFRTDYGSSKNIRNINAFTVSLGLAVSYKRKR